MFRNAVYRSVGVIPRSFAVASFNKQFVGAPVALVRYNSSFDQLKNSKSNKKNSNSKKNNNGINDINELLNSSLELSENSAFLHSKSNDYGLGDIVPNPRDVAKNIREMGPVAGRAVDVHYGGLGKAFAGVRRLGFTNRIKYYQKVQERYIRPAKYAKQKKREWWRRRFSEGFKDLMSQVNDARRRGY